MWAFLTLKTTWILFLIMMSHFEVACDSGRRCCDDLHHGAVLGHCRLLYSRTSGRVTGDAPVSYWPICFPTSLYHSQKSLRKVTRPSFLLEFTRGRAKRGHNSSPQNKPMVQFDRTATQASSKFIMVWRNFLEIFLSLQEDIEEKTLSLWTWLNVNSMSDPDKFVNQRYFNKHQRYWINLKFI